MASFYWTSGIVLAIKAYESGLREIEGLQRGTSYAKRVRRRAFGKIYPRLLLVGLRNSLLRCGETPAEEVIQDCNEMIAELRRLLRSIEGKEMVASFLQEALKGSAVRVCDYCNEIRLQLPVKDKFCSNKCYKGKLNRLDYQRRSSIRSGKEVG